MGNPPKKPARFLSLSRITSLVCNHVFSLCEVNTIFVLRFCQDSFLKIEDAKDMEHQQAILLEHSCTDNTMSESFIMPSITPFTALGRRHSQARRFVKATEGANTSPAEK